MSTSSNVMATFQVPDTFNNGNFSDGEYPAAFLEDLEAYESKQNQDALTSQNQDVLTSDLFIQYQPPLRKTEKTEEWRSVDNFDEDGSDMGCDDYMGGRNFTIRSLSQPITFDAALPFIQHDFTSSSANSSSSNSLKRLLQNSSSKKKRTATLMPSHPTSSSVVGCGDGLTSPLRTPIKLDFSGAKRKRRPFAEISPNSNRYALMMNSGITHMNSLSLKSPLRSQPPVVLVDESAFSGVISKLPCHASPKDAIKRISVDTMYQLLNGKYHPLEQVMVVDCRYSYEFNGGHLPGALNINSPEAAEKLLFNEPAKDHRCIVFHCEFSSERAPRMALHVRNRDRLLNAARYPYLFYPEIYILEGGYKAYYEAFPQDTLPPNSYVPMKDPTCKVQLQLHQRLKHVHKSHWTSGPAGKPVKRTRGGKFVNLEDSCSQPLFVPKVDITQLVAAISSDDLLHTGCTQDMHRLLTSVNDFEVALHEDLSSTF